MSNKDKEDLTIKEDTVVLHHRETPDSQKYYLLDEEDDAADTSNLIVYPGVTFIGTSLIGATVGASLGFREMIKHKEVRKAGFLLDSSLRFARVYGNTCASTVMTFCLFKKFLKLGFKWEEEGVKASALSGFTVGVLFKAPRGIVQAGTFGVLFAGLGCLASLGNSRIYSKSFNKTPQQTLSRNNEKSEFVEEDKFN
ncbi:hypothetical protein CYY_004431 [Polysphondylium violaceum]|uniref:Uncharacterized protein n=1 Tax=Polysphondylium violaceum TaxID=133409 RepID=A0A8J4PV60_9MYCE|nr:hypothetical protein CYY_004431 [Polysphondylium violaceum]